MNPIGKLRETAVSVLPVMGVVALLGSTAAPLPPALLWRFALGGALLIAGLTVFLLGVDVGIRPLGERCGAALVARRSPALLVGVAFAIGAIVTAAEPDIRVFADQAGAAVPGVNEAALIFSIAAGVGAFLALGLLREMLGIPVKWTFFTAYAALFAVARFAPAGFAGIAFDSGGATTGPMTVPFVMALGVGAASSRANGGGGFGLTGMASVGPVLAALVYSLFVSGGGPAAEAEAESAGFTALLSRSFGEALSAMLPLFAMFIAFRFTLLKMTVRQTARIAAGFVYALLGLAVLLLGVNCGFMQAGAALGSALGGAAAAKGGAWTALAIGTGVVIGAIIVCAEPAVWVLGDQVEEETGGVVRRRTLLLFLSAGTGFAIALALCRAVYRFPIEAALVPGYALAMALMPFCPALFTGIAFDSGGVASGPLTSTFVLAFILGAADGGGADAFGVIALVAMMPLATIQVMGILYKIKKRRAK